MEATAQRSARERILEAACDLIAADGIDEVRIARVATRAGASTALVHHYFSTREELLEQALLHSFEQAGDERFGEAPAEAKTATERLAQAIEWCLPLPGSQERDWVLWVELWLRAVRDLSLADFREQLAHVNDEDRRYIINFDRGPLFGRRGGHHSPIGGYLSDLDLVFVLDVNDSYGPWLVHTDRLFEAMNTVDPSSGQKRGLLLLR